MAAKAPDPIGMTASAAMAFAPLYRPRDFYLFIACRFLSTIGMLVQSVAIGWQVYDIAREPMALGLVGLCEFVPMFLLTLPAGDIIDRMDPRTVFAISLGAEAFCALLLFALVFMNLHAVWPLFLILVLFGAARGFSSPSGQSLLPFLVTPDILPRAIAWSSSAFQVAVIAGPAIGGLLYIFGPQAAYAACVIAFLSAALGVATLGGRRSAAKETKTTMLARVIDGIGFVRSRPVILGAMSLDLFAVLLGGATALLPVFARDILHVGPIGLGFLRSAPAVGAALMALSLGRRPIKNHAGLKMFAAVAVFGVATIVFGLSRSFFLTLFSLAVLGASDMISVYVRSSLVQFATPDPMRGRVASVNMLFVGASNELGEFESGVTAALFGTVPAVILGGVGTLIVVAIWMKFFPLLRTADGLTDVANEPVAPKLQGAT